VKLGLGEWDLERPVTPSEFDLTRALIHEGDNFQLDYKGRSQLGYLFWH